MKGRKISHYFTLEIQTALNKPKNTDSTRMVEYTIRKGEIKKKTYVDLFE